MANRYPLVVDTTNNNKIKEIPNGDNLLLTGNSITGVIDITASGTVTSANVNITGDLTYKGTVLNSIASSGAYSDLSGVPTLLSQFTNDVNFRSSGDNISVFTNDAGYLTTVAFGQITSKPTTLGGYGIIDAATSIQGSLATSALQPGANISTLNNDSGFVTLTQLTDGTVTVDVNNSGDLVGSVFADDSTMMIDSILAAVNLDGTIRGHVRPNANQHNTWDLGTDSVRFKDAYFEGRIFTNVTTIAFGNQAGKTSQSDSAVAIGNLAGQTTQGSSAIAIGTQAGMSGQGDRAVAIGSAGSSNQGEKAVAIGFTAGSTSQGADAIAIGNMAGVTSQSASAIAIGEEAGKTSQGSDAIAIGEAAGETNQGADGIGIGDEAGKTNQGVEGIAIGFLAGKTTQSADAIAIGSGAGETTQGINATAIGYHAGMTAQGQEAIAVGYLAGETDQGGKAIAIGDEAGEKTQGVYAIAIGENAGRIEQSGQSIAIGVMAGAGASTTATYVSGGVIPGAPITMVVDSTTDIIPGMRITGTGFSYSALDQQQKVLSVDNATTITIDNVANNGAPSGTLTFKSAQHANAVAIGHSAGLTSQDLSAVAIGYHAGMTAQAGAVAVGSRAGEVTQASGAVAVGVDAGRTNQGVHTVSIGKFAGMTNQSSSAIAIGYQAGETDQAANSIVINATGSGLDNTTASSLVIKPIVNLAGTTHLQYNATSGQVTHSDTITATIVATTATPPTANADAGATGEIRYDDNYLYIKTASGWKRTALSGIV